VEASLLAPTGLAPDFSEEALK